MELGPAEMTDMATATPPVPQELADPDLLQQVNKLRHVDNVRNWFYLLREYVFLALVIGATLLFYHEHRAWGIAWPWLIPVTLAAVLLVGIGQHRLVMLGHEASHYLLFRDPVLNDLASNWLCFYPMWSMVYNYRLQHMAHHQYTNDPQRDPDFLYMNLSGQRFHYPMPLRKFVWECVVKLLLWIPGLVINVIVRAYLANQGGSTGPYKARNRRSLLLPAMHIAYQLGVGLLLLYAAVWGRPWLLAVVPIVGPAALLAFTLLVPEGWYMHTAIRPNISHRWAIYQRQLFVTLLFAGLAWATYLTGHPWPVYYFILWLVPLGTVFSYLMLLREEIQHSHTPPERFLNSRNFKGNWLIEWAVFPLGQGLHLPHHLFPLVPHYNLRKLDALLRTTEIYRRNAVDVVA